MSVNEEDLRKLAVELRILESTAEELRSRLNFINAALTELDLAHKTLEGLEKAKSDSLLLLPIGGGSYVKAKLQNSEMIIYGIGANAAVEKTMKEAKEGISTRVDRLSKTRLSIEQQFNKVLEKLREDQSRIQQMSADLNRGMRKKNVRKTPSGD